MRLNRGRATIIIIVISSCRVTFFVFSGRLKIEFKISNGKHLHHRWCKRSTQLVLDSADTVTMTVKKKLRQIQSNYTVQRDRRLTNALRHSQIVTSICSQIVLLFNVSPNTDIKSVHIFLSRINARLSHQTAATNNNN